MTMRQSQLNVEIDDGLLKQAKWYCMENHMKMKDFISDAICQRLSPKYVSLEAPQSTIDDKIARLRHAVAARATIADEEKS